MKLKKMAMAIGLALHDRMVMHMHRQGLLLTALPLTLENKAAVDKLPEGQRALYVEKDGKFALDVDGGLPDVTGLKSALEKERDGRKAEEKARKEFEKRYEGIDPDKTRQLMAQFEDADEANLLKEGKAGIDKIIDKRMAKMKAEYEKKLADAEARVGGSLEVAGTFMSKVLENQVREASTKLGMHPTAVDDAIIRAKEIFSIQEDGTAVQFEGEPDSETVVMGKDGKTPFSIGEWLEGMKEKAPHWFPASNSGGGAGGSRHLPGQKTMKRAAFEAMEPTAKTAFIKEKGVVVD